MTQKGEKYLHWSLVVFHWVALYLMYVLGAMVYALLRLTGRLKILFETNDVPSFRDVTILLVNHPSFWWEPIWLLYLFPIDALLHPVRAIPWSTPAKENFEFPLLAPFIRLKFVFFPRDKLREEYRAHDEALRVLHYGGRIIFFPEGGRTGKGEQFVYSEAGSYVRPFKTGAARLAIRSNAYVLPVAVNGSDYVLPRGAWIPRLWRRVTVRVGVPMKAPEVSVHDRAAYRSAVKQLTKDMQTAVLHLLDRIKRTK